MSLTPRIIWLKPAGIALCIFIFSSCVSLRKKQNSICVVKENTPQAVIVIPDRELHIKLKPQPPWIELQSYTFWDSSARKSAQLLSDYIFKSTSARLPIVKESNIPKGKKEIHVGTTKIVKQLNLINCNLDKDGFIIKTVDPQRIVLCGGSKIGTEYAVDEFLERFLGIRWLFPGETGEHVPIRNSLTIPDTNIRQEPKFYSRIFRLGRDEGKTWCRRNRIHSRIEYHHNIPKLFDLSYTKKHPDFFPLIDGKRYFPKKYNHPSWHLCYSAKGLEQNLADKLKRFFAKNPEYNSVSLGVGDADEKRYCHCQSCLDKQGNKINSMGYRHYSDMYYAWCNKVVEKVAESFPDKYFGCLAYREVLDPPEKVKLHKQLVPYFTYELLQWADPERREHFKNIVSKWRGKTENLGIADYVFGEKYYFVPRVYYHTMSDYLRYLSSKKIIGYSAEVSGYTPKGICFTGPQMYLLARLLWNPDLEVDALLRNWYVSAVGEKAADSLAEYFTIWEHYWTERIRETDWYGSKSAIYLLFNNISYLECLKKEDISKALELLRKTVEDAGTDIQRKRAQLFLDDFQKRVPILLYYIKMREMREDNSKPVKKGKTILKQDFTGHADGWRPTSKQVKNKPWDPKQGKTKPGALKLCGNTLVLNNIKVIPGKKYLMEFAAREYALPEEAKITMVFDWRDSNKDESKMRAYKLFREINGGKLHDKWHKLKFRFSPPSVPGIVEGHYADIYLSVQKIGKGTVWLDDLNICEIE